MNFQTVDIPEEAKSKYTARKPSPKKAQNFRDVRRFTEQLSDPIQSRLLIGNTIWTKLKNKIFETDKEVLKNLQRHV